MTAYYNEIDPFVAAWLRDLIAEDVIAPGVVDERSIAEVQPSDLVGFTQCHFFAGIGGWSDALRLAGWPDDRPVWTGSCPCQPFSPAGKGEGFADPRHLWPEFFRLIRQSRPDTVFGEQVSSNLAWLDLVCGDLEGEGYAVGSAIVGAHSVGAPHIRQRLWWVADRDCGRCVEYSEFVGATAQDSANRDSCGAYASGCSGLGGLGHADEPRLQGWGERGDGAGECPAGAAGLASPWADLVWLSCRDGKARPTQPGLFPLAHGVPGRVGLLRGAGNAIVPQVAEAFIRAYLESTE